MSECTDPAIGRLILPFELQILSEEDADIFAQHVLECEFCHRELAHFAREAALLREDPDVKQALAGHTGDLDAPGSFSEQIWRHIWPTTPFIFKPAVVYLLLLLLIVPAYHGFRIRDRVGVREVSQILELFPTRQVSDNRFNKNLDEVGLLLFEIPSLEIGALYHVVVETEDGSSTVYSNREFGDTDRLTGTGALYLNLAEIDPGRYRLSVTDPRAGPSAKPYVYHFTIVD